MKLDGDEMNPQVAMLHILLWRLQQLIRPVEGCSSSDSWGGTQPLLQQPVLLFPIAFGIIK